jgi:hypothetical protein
LSKKQFYEKVIDEVYDTKGSKDKKHINPDIFKGYNDNLNKGVANVMASPNYGDKMFDLQLQLEANVAKFAAYKAYHATQNLYKQANDAKSKDAFVNKAKIILNAYNRQQVTEYNTAIARARTARQFTLFNEDTDLYPNLKWLPSRSANPREEHAAFYGLVLPKNDPFWNNNQPGNLWNCKCDWEETDEKASSDNSKTISAKGLEGNPAITGEIFSEKHPYFANVKDADRVATKTNNIIFKTIKEQTKNTTVQYNIFKNAKGDNIKIPINRKEFLNQPHENYYEKNQLLLKIENVFSKSIYLGISSLKREGVIASHIFEISLLGKPTWLIVNHYTNGDIYLHSISDKEKTTT